jgi:hypothetical protein
MRLFNTLIASATAAVVLCASFGMAQAQSAREACKADYQTFCSGIQPGGGRILECLKQNFPKLSPDCQAALEKAKAPQ